MISNIVIKASREFPTLQRDPETGNEEAVTISRIRSRIRSNSEKV
jgi:hypothetical protein